MSNGAISARVNDERQSGKMRIIATADCWSLSIEPNISREAALIGELL